MSGLALLDPTRMGRQAEDLERKLRHLVATDQIHCGDCIGVTHRQGSPS